MLEGPAPRRGTALFVHGLGASSRVFLAQPKGGLVDLLTEAGWRVVLFDQRGHGNTAAGGDPRGSSGAAAGGDSRRHGAAAAGGEALASTGWTFDGLVRGELAAMHEALRGRFEGPLVLVGHGLGGLAACAASGSGEFEPDALVLFGVNVWLPRLEPSHLRRFLKASLLARGPSVMSLGRELAGALLGQALGGALAAPGATPGGRLWPDAIRWWSTDAWLDATGHDYLASLRRVRCPTLVFSSHADPLLCAPECAQAFATRLGATRLEHHVAGAPGLRGPGHGGLVSDARAAPLWRRSAEWLAGLR